MYAVSGGGAVWVSWFRFAGCVPVKVSFISACYDFSAAVGGTAYPLSVLCLRGMAGVGRGQCVCLLSLAGADQ